MTKMVEMILKNLPLEDGVLSLRCNLRGTKCEAHITLMSSQETVTVIEKLGKEGLTEVMDSVKTAKFYPERINLYERKALGGTPKDHLLGIDGRLKEGLREKLGLKPYLKGHCHGGIVHASKIEAFISLVTCHY